MAAIGAAKVMPYTVAAIEEYIKDRRKKGFPVYRQDSTRRRLDLIISVPGSEKSAGYFEFLPNSPSVRDPLIATLATTTSASIMAPRTDTRELCEAAAAVYRPAVLNKVRA
jgi:hypothetical protein